MKKSVIIQAPAFSTLNIRHLPELFHEAGAEVTLFSPKTQKLRHSDFVSKWVESSPLNEDASRQYELLLREKQFDLHIFTNDQIVDSLKPDLIPVFPDCVLSSFRCRSQFVRFANNNNIKIAPSNVINNNDEARCFLRELGPSMMKLNHTGGGIGVRFIEDEEDLILYSREFGYPSEYVLQKYIRESWYN